MSVEEERALIGTVLVRPRQFQVIGDMLEPEDFADANHEATYQAFLRLSAARKAITLDAVIRFFDEAHRSKIADYLEACISAADFGDGIEELARSIKAAAIKRRLRDVADWANEASGDPEFTPDGFYGAIEQRLSDAVGEARQATKVEQIGAGSDQWFEEIESAQSGLKGVPTGLRDVDHLISGLVPSDLVVLAARPSQGKTALAMNIARGAAINGAGVHFASMEMSRQQLYDRLLSDITREKYSAKYSTYRRTPYSGEELEVMRDAHNLIRALPIAVDARSRLSAAQIAFAARRSAKNFEAQGRTLGVVVVDYLQLMPVDTRLAGNLSYAIGQNSGAMKQLAKDLNCTVVLLSQLSREVEKREDKRPVLSDLRNCGEIEQDADVVGLMLRPEYYIERQEPQDRHGDSWIEWNEKLIKVRNKLRVFFDKNRNGEVRSVDLFCDVSCNAIRNKDYDFNKGAGAIFERAA